MMKSISKFLQNSLEPSVSKSEDVYSSQPLSQSQPFSQSQNSQNNDSSKINDITILYYLIKQKHIEPLLTNNNKYSFKRFDISQEDENYAVCARCLKRLEIRNEIDLNALFDTNINEINKIMKSNYFAELQYNYFKNIAKIEYVSQTAQTIQNGKSQETEKHIKLNTEMEILDNLNECDTINMNKLKTSENDYLIHSIPHSSFKTKTYYRYKKKYKYLTYKDKLIPIYYHTCLLHNALINRYKYSKTFKIDKDGLIGIYQHQLKRVILFKFPKRFKNTRVKVWHQTNANIIRLYPETKGDPLLIKEPEHELTKYNPSYYSNYKYND